MIDCSDNGSVFLFFQLRRRFKNIYCIIKFLRRLRKETNGDYLTFKLQNSSINGQMHLNRGSFQTTIQSMCNLLYLKLELNQYRLHASSRLIHVYFFEIVLHKIVQLKFQLFPLQGSQWNIFVRLTKIKCIIHNNALLTQVFA